MFFGFSREFMDWNLGINSVVISYDTDLLILGTCLSMFICYLSLSCSPKLNLATLPFTCATPGGQPIDSTKSRGLEEETTRGWVLRISLEKERWNLKHENHPKSSNKNRRLWIGSRVSAWFAGYFYWGSIRNYSKLKEFWVKCWAGV